MTNEFGYLGLIVGDGGEFGNGWTEVAATRPDDIVSEDGGLCDVRVRWMQSGEQNKRIQADEHACG